jgi:hypothetical protein
MRDTLLVFVFLLKEHNIVYPSGFVEKIGRIGCACVRRECVRESKTETHRHVVLWGFVLERYIKTVREALNKHTAIGITGVTRESDVCLAVNMLCLLISKVGSEFQ